MASSSPRTNEYSTVEDKIEIAEEKKALGDKSFREGKWVDALRGYHEALLYLMGLDKKGLPTVATLGGAGAENQPDEAKNLTKVDQMIEAVQSNMAACHLKTENWKRALYYAEKVTTKNPENQKMQFRKAKALTGMGYTEKSIKVLEELVKKHPDDATFKAELAAVKIKDKEAEKKSFGKFKGFLGKNPSLIQTEESAASSSTSSTGEPKIQEVS